jgi:hypothetical protein
LITIRVCPNAARNFAWDWSLDWSLYVRGANQRLAS